MKKKKEELSNSSSEIKNKKNTSKKDNKLKNVNVKKTKNVKDSSKLAFKDKFNALFKKQDNVASSAVKKYKKNKLKKSKKKRIVNGKFTLDVLDLLIIVVVTAIVSCVLTGFILNFQFRKNTDLLNLDVVSNENVKTFLNTYSEIIDNYYEEIDEKKMMEAAIEGMLDFLKDNYSIYLNKTETDSLSEMLDGSYDGVGLVATGNLVVRVYEGSSAYEAGIKANDEIVEINGTKITLKNYELIDDLIKKGESNKIVVKREGKELTFNLETGKVNIPTTETDIITSKDKKSKIGYMALSTFSSLAFDEFHEKLKELEEDNIDSLIIDLRNNTGGYLNVADNIACLFLDKGKVIYSLETKDGVTEYKDENREVRKYKIVVLVNGNTASAAEILAAALHDSYGAKIVGNVTFGKGKVQTMKHYEDTMVKYTSAKWLRPNGECVDEVGIEPDYNIDIVTDGMIYYDKQLDKAIELLS